MSEEQDDLTQSEKKGSNSLYTCLREPTKYTEKVDVGPGQERATRAPASAGETGNPTERDLWR